MTIALGCTCGHDLIVHRLGRGKCAVQNCTCLYAPVRRAPPTPAQRQLGESERTRLERRLARQIELADLPTPETQYLWARDVGRMYRSDFAWPQHLLLAEAIGAVWIAGRHVRPAGYIEDLRRLNLAQTLGWRVLQFTPEMIGDGLGRGEAVDAIRAVISGSTLVTTSQEDVVSKTRGRAVSAAGPAITKGGKAFAIEP